MFKKTTVLSGVIVVALCGAYSVHNRSLASASVTTKTSPADAQSTKVVTAANAFLATLSAAQKKAALFAFTDAAQRTNWSNVPQGGAGVNRKGVRWGEMSATQRTALMDMLGTVLSADGVNMVKGQMNADNIIKATDDSQPNTAPPAATSTVGTTPPPPSPPTAGQPPAEGARPQVNFGSEYYFVSFVGTPSTTSPWMLQFGGHHLAINATVVGPNITLSPSLTGGQPVKISSDGKTFTIIPQVPLEMTAAFAMLNSLSAAQRSKAIISTQRGDLVLGPGQDGKTLQAEGVPGSAMTAAQKTKFLALIKSRLGVLDADDLAEKMAAVQKNLEKTYFAWYGPTTAGSAAYYRVTGPTLIIEFAPQATDGDATNHLHSMYRDPTNEYGAAWTSLK